MEICPYGGVVDGCLCLDTLCLEGEKLITPFEGVKMIRNGKRYK